MNLESEFWVQADKNGPFSATADGPCWVWIGRRYWDGYGEFRRVINGRDRRMVAHRYAWMLANDRPIPPGMVICHRCDNRACVNPYHLFLGTQADNEQDKIAKGRRPSVAGESNPSARLSAEDVSEVRRLINVERLTRTEVGARFGLHHKTISDIASGAKWGHIPLEAPAVPGKSGRPRRPPRVFSGTEIRCGRCRTVKPISEYAPSCARKGNGYCRPCMAAYGRESNARSRES